MGKRWGEIDPLQDAQQRWNSVTIPQHKDQYSHEQSVLGSARLLAVKQGESSCDPCYAVADAKREVESRSSPAMVGYKTVDPSTDSEEFFWSKLLLHLPWHGLPGQLPYDRKGACRRWKISTTNEVVEADTHEQVFQKLIVLGDRTAFDLMTLECFPEMPLGVQAAKSLARLNLHMLLCSYDAEDVITDPSDHFRNRLALAKEMAKLGPVSSINDIFEYEPEHVSSGVAEDIFSPADGGDEAAEIIMNDNSPSSRRNLLKWIVSNVHKHSRA
eukprot:6204727-Amphidinium_carterae.1